MSSQSSPLQENTAEEHQDFSDQLLQLLSDNQLFITKIQRAQWNYGILPLELYNSIINNLFNCAEVISEQIRFHTGHVSAGMAVYLEMSNLEEVLDIGSEFEVKKDIIQSHNTLLEVLTRFMNDEIATYHSVRQIVTAELHQSHTEIYQCLEILNR